MSDVAPTRAIIVDDVPELRFLLREMMQQAGADVVGEASNGRAGIEVARQLRPDIVLLDVAMPVMDGMEALPLIRSACPGATIIVLSGFVAERLRSQALDNGADEYIEKGIDPTTLMQALARLCGLTSPTTGKAPCP